MTATLLLLIVGCVPALEPTTAKPWPEPDDAETRHQQVLDELKRATDDAVAIRSKIETLSKQAQEIQAKNSFLEAEIQAASKTTLHAWMANFHCPPCNSFKAAVKAGQLDRWNVVFETGMPPRYVTSFPFIEWQTAAGERLYVAGWAGVEEFTARFDRNQQRAVFNAPVVNTWLGLSLSAGPIAFNGTPRNPIPTTRQHLANEHRIPLSETEGMSQQQLDRLHGWGHFGK